MNTASTRVLLEFNVLDSSSLTDDQKALLARRLASRLTKDGRLLVVGAERRSQYANRQAAQERLLDLLRWGLRPEAKPRRLTRPGKAAKERRLLTKKRRGELKRGREKPGSGEAGE